jgi:hypothetical protein
MANEFRSFSEFWPYYVCEHSKPLTRKLHFLGTFSIIPLIIIAIILNLYYLILIPVIAYGFAWTGHFFIEKNKPATFKYPLWSLAGDFKMFYLMCIGKMDDEVMRCRGLIKNR